MALCNFDTPTVSDVLDILSVAAEGRSLPLGARVITTDANHSPAEGLALLGAYTAIDDPRVRQALLDLASMLGSRPI